MKKRRWPRLDDLIVACEKYQMTEEEKAEQAKSFAYGNTRIDNPAITREMIDEAFEQIRREGGK
ncbi:MAG TPA: hypothetical protein VD994_12865 [Prosthecobacter sp.]|nr:hypothetical protein [Prosthecobacter sp.]